MNFNRFYSRTHPKVLSSKLILIRTSVKTFSNFFLLFVRMWWCSWVVEGVGGWWWGCYRWGWMDEKKGGQRLNFGKLISRHSNVEMLFCRRHRTFKYQWPLSGNECWGFVDINNIWGFTNTVRTVRYHLLRPTAYICSCLSTVHN